MRAEATDTVQATGRRAMFTLQHVQLRHQALWDPQPKVRAQLTTRLEEARVCLAPRDYVDLDRIATQIVARSLGLTGTEPPEFTAYKVGRADWVPYIALVQTWVKKQNLRKKAGGRPAHREDAKLLLLLTEKCGNYPDWKHVADTFQKLTGKTMTTEACRSAVRRLRSKISPNKRPFQTVSTV